MSRAAVFALAALPLFATACLGPAGGGGDDDDDAIPASCRATQPPPVDPDGERVQYVVDAIQLGDDWDEVVRLGADLDCDPQRRPDNALGQILGILRDQGYDVAGEANQLIADGAMLNLIELRATSLHAADGVGFTLRYGRDTDGNPADNFSGQERFELDPARGWGQTAGTIDFGRLVAEPGTLPLAVAFPGLAEPYYLNLVGVRVEAEVDADRLTGHIAGGVPAADVDGALIPALADGLNRIVSSECAGGACDPSSFGATLLELFDTNRDGALSITEVRDNDIVASLFQPDVDLFDADGAFRPNSDGVADALSIGIGFTAVPAYFPNR